MDGNILEEILSCPSLPSLPAVAVRVIDLTQDVEVSLDELAATIQNDQALAAKVLRTVNSSFYGLRKPCTTINQALIMLGLSAVKSLALGFSLVSSLEGAGGFDYVAYWRRGLYTGVAAKRLAEAAGLPDVADEAFLAGLLQDVGQMAMFQALGPRYIEVLESVNGDHRSLVKAELEAFEVQHPDLGALLANRWKLPDELALPVKYHERPSAAPAEHAGLSRLVGLGNVVHDILTDDTPGPALKRYLTLASRWFSIGATSASDLVKSIRDDAREVSSLFKLDTGQHADAEAVLKKANAQLVELSRSARTDGNLEALLVDGADADPISGAHLRAAYDEALVRAFARTDNGDAMSLVHLRIDSLEEIVRDAGIEIGDTVLIGVASLLRKHFEQHGGVVCRYADDLFGVVLAGATRVGAVKATTEFREDLLSLADQLTGGGPELRVSIGVSFVEQDNVVFERAEQLVGAAMLAVKASAEAGGNCIRTFMPKRKAA